MIRVALKVALVLVGGWVGFHFGSRYASAWTAQAPIDAASIPSTGLPDSRRTALETEIARRSAENRSFAEEYSRPAGTEREVAEPALPDRLHARVDLQRSGTEVSLPIVLNNGELFDGFSEIFALTPAEQETLARAIAAARAQIDRLTAAWATVTREEDALVVVVEPFEGGADVYHSLLDSLERTLGRDRYATFGDNRYAAFEILHYNNDMNNELLRTFRHLGAALRTITITRHPQVEGRFKIQETSRLASGWLGYSAQFSDPSELGTVYQWLAPFLSELDELPPLPVRRP